MACFYLYMFIKLQVINTTALLWALSVTFPHQFIQLSASFHIQMRSTRLNQAGQFVPERKGQNPWKCRSRSCGGSDLRGEQALTQSLEEGLEVLLSVDLPGARERHGGTQRGLPLPTGMQFMETQRPAPLVRGLIINWETAIINQLFVLNAHNLSFMLLLP